MFVVLLYFVFFFFKQKTAYEMRICGWSSDVCSSDLAAFEQLRGEVALVRLAVEGLARARESIEIPDYQPTLANTEKILLALTQRVDVIAKSPAMKLTPGTMGERVNASVASATGELHNLVNSTRSDMSEAARDLGALIGTTRARWQQDRWLFWIGLSGMVMGILLFALLARLLARTLPEDRQRPRLNSS